MIVQHQILEVGVPLVLVVLVVPVLVDGHPPVFLLPHLGVHPHILALGLFNKCLSALSPVLSFLPLLKRRLAVHVLVQLFLKLPLEVTDLIRRLLAIADHGRGLCTCGSSLVSALSQKVLPALFSQSVDVDVEALARCGHHREREGLVPRGLPAYVQGLCNRVLVRLPLQVAQGRRQLLVVVLTAIEVAEFGVPLVLDACPIPHDRFVLELFVLGGEEMLRVTFPVRKVRQLLA